MTSTIRIENFVEEATAKVQISVSRWGEEGSDIDVVYHPMGFQKNIVMRREDPRGFIMMLMGQRAGKKPPIELAFLLYPDNTYQIRPAATVPYLEVWENAKTNLIPINLQDR
ncbi:hypothetical protein [Methylocystis sp. B8]|uniref:hypothetical protein n=1 Tax=Methylocystis sp. B8 TaxID=544938 RepID=UPI0010FE7F52|nr:hypothetical protein [Methylocystis sp. B8]TLG77797.1 hypothetical protein FEV16_08220 [Methylocystis sp. B8]